jgi:AcrR family transcriptional regulator
MGSVDRRNRERSATRDKILGAARELFVTQGVEAVSMRKIAEAIEYTPAAIYTHFADKTELLVAMCNADFALLNETLEGIRQIPDPVRRLLTLGKTYARFALAYPHHYRMMFMTTLPAAPQGPGPGPEHGNPDEDGYANLRLAVADCIKSGRFRPECSDVELVTQACWGAAHGVVSLYIAHQHDPWVNWKPPLETADFLLETTIRGKLAPGEEMPIVHVAPIEPKAAASSMTAVGTEGSVP